MSLFAIDAEDRANQLIHLTERLTERLAEETRAFESHRPQDVAPGVSETGRLANLYRHEVARVKLNPEMIGGAAVETRRRLMRATEAFEAVLARHGRAVDAARQISEGLLRAIAEEIAKTRSRAAGYGPAARIPPSNAAAIAVNRRA
jgi:vacuolar-type H+-ATPase subunit E/Vma4